MITTVAPLEAMIPVPSGTLVFANYFDFVDDSPDTDELGFLMSDKKVIKYYENLKIARGLCCSGPTCLLRNENKFIVGQVVYDRDFNVLKGFNGYDTIANLCNESWCWACADEEILTKLARQKNQRIERSDYRIKVQPGDYRLKEYFHTKNWSCVHGPKKFATLERIYL